MILIFDDTTFTTPNTHYTVQQTQMLDPAVGGQSYSFSLTTTLFNTARGAGVVYTPTFALKLSEEIFWAGCPDTNTEAAKGSC